MHIRSPLEGVLNGALRKYDRDAKEFLRRLGAWSEIQRLGNVVSPDWLRSRGLYDGMRGVWADASRTRVLEPHGVLHTGRHYADDLDDDLIIDHYPETSRAGLRDANEIDSCVTHGTCTYP